MSDFETIRFEADTRDLETKLTALGDKVAGRLVRKAIVGGATVIADAQRTFAPEKTDDVPGGNSLEKGALKADIQIELKMSGIKGKASAKIGPGPETGYVGRFIEDGHDIVTHKTRGKQVVGHVDAKPWMKPAFDAVAEAAIDRVREVIIAGIEGDVDGDVSETALSGSSAVAATPRLSSPARERRKSKADKFHDRIMVGATEARARMAESDARMRADPNFAKNLAEWNARWGFNARVR